MIAMVEDYYPFDFREIKDKNRISLSNDLMKRLEYPEEIVFSKYGINGEERIIINNANHKIQGEIIGKSRIDNKQRCTIPRKVQYELGFYRPDEQRHQRKNRKKFVGIIEVITKDGNFIELCRIGRIGKHA